MEQTEDNLFDAAMARYQSGVSAKDLIRDFEIIASKSPNNAASWTCLAWLQLLCGQSEEALRSARIAVRLNAQDPQARINLSLALLETNSKGVRDHIEFVKKAMALLPEIEQDLSDSIKDGLNRKSDWQSLKKIQSWLDL